MTKQIIHDKDLSFTIAYRHNVEVAVDFWIYDIVGENEDGTPLSGTWTKQRRALTPCGNSTRRKCSPTARSSGTAALIGFLTNKSKAICTGVRASSSPNSPPRNGRR